MTSTPQPHAAQYPQPPVPQNPQPPVPQPPAAPPTQPPVPGPPGEDRAAEPVAELKQLATLEERPLAEHVTVLDAVHRALSEQLRRAES